jgi:hypothetical protein
LTTREHPAWCAGEEPDEQEEHVSETLYAAEADDIIDIQLRKTQPNDEADLAVIEVEFVDNGVVHAFPLDLRQGRALAGTLGRLLP